MNVMREYECETEVPRQVIAVCGIKASRSAGRDEYLPQENSDERERDAVAAAKED